ncbi:peptidoglycan amidohydrolase family protein, partial [Enterococcus casseliflavus]|jgi:hypothetical protein|uniref:peptidoglycan amidohydrolase family protein n=1 Tax=Enterococcus casseliflavus TaxID=37734 RepID=UPI001F5041AE
MGDINKMIQWFKNREGKVSYNQNARLGPNSFDCSSAVYFALVDGGFIPAGSMGWTGSLQDTTLPPIANKISRAECRRGDIFLSKYWANDGHTGVFLDNGTIIHCNAYDNNIRSTVADGRMGPSPTEYYRLNNTTDSGGTYTGGSLVNAGKSISEENIRLIISAVKQYKIKPSFMIAQMFIESHWGDPSISIVGSKDNNWAGISEPFNVPSDLGIQMSRGSARPSGEGGYYVHFSTINDFFKAYAFILSKRNGLYNVEGSNSIEEYCKGLFRIGGANADYASTGYQNYYNMLITTYNTINQQNPGKLAQIDSSNGNNTNNQGGKTTMQCIYWRPSQTTAGQNNAYYFDGTSSKYLDHPDQIKIIEQIYKDNNGKDIPTYHFDGKTPWYTRIEQISGKKPVSGALG